MFEAVFRVIDPTTLILIFSVAAVLLCQILLCFKVRSVIIRLLPLILLLVLTAIFAYKSFTVNGWDGLGYLFLAFLTAILFGVCALCLVVFGIVRYIKHKRAQK